MTNNYAPLDTRALNGVLGTAWFLWTLFRWGCYGFAAMLPLVWLVLTVQEDPTSVLVGILVVMAVAWLLQTVQPRKRKHVRISR